MSLVCACGHTSATTDYCDSCGAPLGPPAETPPALDSPDRSASQRVLDGGRTEVILDRQTRAAAELCPKCATPRSDGDRYCEVDGYDFEIGAGIGGVCWEAVVVPDRAYYDRVAPDDVAFPGDHAPRIYRLGDDVLIGRRSESRGIAPEIDLSLAPEDPAVSRRHARLVRSDDAYSLLDEGSANGTTMNDATDSVPPGTPVPLADGDRIHLGAWTTITIRCVTRA
jgi:FHA domain-containing protein